MILTKGDFSKNGNNKKYNKNSKYLINENKNIDNKYEKGYFHNRNNKNINYDSIKEILNEPIFSKNNKSINNINNENKKLYGLKTYYNMNKNNNNNSIKTRNKNIRNQNKDELDNIRGMETDYNINKKIIYNNLYTKKKETKKVKHKNISMEQRHQKIDEEIFLSENKDIINKKNQIYSRPYKHNSPSSQIQKNFENQFNIKDAKNILNINYFYDKGIQNFENMEEIFYTNYYKTKYKKKTKEPHRNKYNSLILNDKMNGYIQDKTTNSFYIRKTPINLVKKINNNFNIKDEEMQNNDYFNYIKYIETEEKNRIKSNRGRYHSTFERSNILHSPDRYFTNTINNYTNNKFEKNDKKIITRNGNKIKIFKKNNNTSIQEYNLSLGNEFDSDSDIDYYDNENITNSNNNRDKRYIIKNNIFGKNQEINEIKKYYQYFTKNIKPVANSQFEIKNNKPQLNIPKKNFINVNKVHKNSFQKRNILSYKKSNIINRNENKNENNNMIGTPNFSETGKTPKNNNIITHQKIKTFQLNENINEIKSKQINDLVRICQNEKIEIFNQKNSDNTKEHKFIFEKEEDIIEYVYNKFEEERKKKNYFNRKLRFTGFVLSKKYKGKNLCDIRIEDDINQINQYLKNENVLINDKRVEFKYIGDMNYINILEEENKKLKEQIDNLHKKDNAKKELTQKFDKEKQDLNE